MNDDAVQLERLDRLDRELTRVAQELEKIARRADERVAAVARTEETRNAAKQDLDTLRTEERAASRRLEDLRASRDAALRVLTTGMGNAEAAQRQLDSCAALIDTSETTLLELLETQDGAVAKLNEAEQALAHAAADLRADEDARPEQIATLHDARTKATAERQEAAASLVTELRNRYEGFRERGRFAVARVRNLGPAGGSCDACSRAVQPQMISDLRKDKLVTCHGCHRWLLM